MFETVVKHGIAYFISDIVDENAKPLFSNSSSLKSNFEKLRLCPAGNSEFCFLPNLIVSHRFASGNIESLRETKLTVSLEAGD